MNNREAPRDLFFYPGDLEVSGVLLVHHILGLHNVYCTTGASVHQQGWIADSKGRELGGEWNASAFL